MAEYVFVNEKTGRKFRVVEFDPEGGTVTLVGDVGVQFTERYSKERFQEFGYRLITE